MQLRAHIGSPFGDSLLLVLGASQIARALTLYGSQPVLRIVFSDICSAVSRLIKKRSLRSFFSQLKPPGPRGLEFYSVHVIKKPHSRDVVCAYGPSTHCQSTYYTYFFSLRALLLPPLIPGPYVKKQSFFFNSDPPARED
jgi:hypothetical protein